MTRALATFQLMHMRVDMHSISKIAAMGAPPILKIDGTAEINLAVLTAADPINTA